MEEEASIVKSLSPWMRMALMQLATSKQPCTSTSIGSMLTKRQSAYGWQTSAREGGRTLKALERRQLAVSQRYDPTWKIFPWTITELGKKVAQSLSTVAVSPASPSPPVADRSCSHCGAKLDAEDLELIARHGPVTCPRCDRDGCNECMPFGRGVICPECEELREAIPELQ
jgi:hypothetical protein